MKHQMKFVVGALGIVALGLAAGLNVNTAEASAIEAPIAAKMVEGETTKTIYYEGNYDHVIVDEGEPMAMTKLERHYDAEPTSYKTKGDKEEVFSEIPVSATLNANNLRGGLYSLGDNSNAMPNPSVLKFKMKATEAKYTDESGSHGSISENGVRFGVRLYNRTGVSAGNSLGPDVSLVTETANNIKGSFCLDIGYAITNEGVTPAKTYPLNNGQLKALAAGDFDVAVVQRANKYTLYAENGNGYDKVKEYTAGEGTYSISAIDAVVNTNQTNLSRSKGSYGILDMSYYGDFIGEATDMEMIRAGETNVYSANIPTTATTVTFCNEDGTDKTTAIALDASKNVYTNEGVATLAEEKGKAMSFLSYFDALRDDKGDICGIFEDERVNEVVAYYNDLGEYVYLVDELKDINAKDKFTAPGEYVDIDITVGETMEYLIANMPTSVSPANVIGGSENAPVYIALLSLLGVGLAGTALLLIKRKKARR